jgi:putative ATP-dependent endonuclease of OLD family
MKLVAFSVRNYRSIVEAYKLSLGNYTVLVGPNNEGKSNIVKAIALSLAVLTRGRVRRRARLGPVRYYRTESRFDYEWPRDFPVSLQSRNPTGRSEFTLEFDLTQEDFDMFRDQVDVNLTTNLKIKLGFGPEDTSIEILMKGRGKKTLNTKKEQVAEFIRTHVAAEYISALRPSEMALEIVDGLIQAELATLEENPDYKQCIRQVQALQQPILDKISDKLQKTVSEFVPGVRNIHITNERMAHAFRTSFNILVDDGAKTDLSEKGDGIISLASISLMKHVSEESLGAKSLILSIEEPESHLHPEAIHGLRQVLKDISRQQQVIITTHSPILVEREQVSQNIIVRRGRAQKAKRIEDIREALGIQMADNLIGAYAVLLVEGEEDRDIVSLLLSSLSSALGTAMSRRFLVVDHLGGATNLHYKVTFYKQNVYNIHAFMDNDDEGRRAIDGALRRNVLEPCDYNLATCQGMQNSELEDLLQLDAYSSVVQEKYGVLLNQPRFRSARAKWSDRVREIFQVSGKIWNNSVKMQVKRTIADTCIQVGANSLNPHHRGPIDTLITTLESKLAARAK